MGISEKAQWMSAHSSQHCMILDSERLTVKKLRDQFAKNVRHAVLRVQSMQLASVEHKTLKS